MTDTKMLRATTEKSIAHRDRTRHLATPYGISNDCVARRECATDEWPGTLGRPATRVTAESDANSSRPGHYSGTDQQQQRGKGCVKSHVRTGVRKVPARIGGIPGRAVT